MNTTTPSSLCFVKKKPYTSGVCPCGISFLYNTVFDQDKYRLCLYHLKEFKKENPQNAITIYEKVARCDALRDFKRRIKHQIVSVADDSPIHSCHIGCVASPCTFPGCLSLQVKSVSTIIKFPIPSSQYQPAPEPAHTALETLFKETDDLYGSPAP